MSVLNAFLSTWSQARATFGEGVPQGGDGLDNSARLQGARSDVQSAAPGADWSGAAAERYAEKNARQAMALEAMAGLDKRLAGEVDRAAAVVAAGRTQLDSVRQWVVDAAATVPRTMLGEQMLWPVVSKGAGEVAEIIQKSHRDLAAIAQRMHGIGSEYDELGEPETNDGDVQAMDVKGNEEDTLPPTAFDLKDIRQIPPYDPGDPNTFGPPGYRELVPGSGTWVPDPSSRYYRPNRVEAPLDLDDVKYLPPFKPGDESTYGPYGYMELVPGSGVWVPDPDGPMWPSEPPSRPLDLTEIEYRPPFVPGDPSTFGPYGYDELIPGGGAWVPSPRLGAPF